MAIALDTSARSNLTSGNFSFSYVCSGTGVLLCVGVYAGTGGSNDITGVTAGGVSLAKINEAQCPGDRWCSLWWGNNSGSGYSGSVTITCSGASGFTEGYAIGLTGAGTLDVSGSGTATSATSVSTSSQLNFASNAWGVMFAKEINGYAFVNVTSPGGTHRQDDGGGHICDTNGPFSGNQTVTVGVLSSNWALLAATFTEAGGGGGGGGVTYPELERQIRGVGRGTATGVYHAPERMAA